MLKKPIACGSFINKINILRKLIFNSSTYINCYVTRYWAARPDVERRHWKIPDSASWTGYPARWTGSWRQDMHRKTGYGRLNRLRKTGRVRFSGTFRSVMSAYRIPFFPIRSSICGLVDIEVLMSAF